MRALLMMGLLVGALGAQNTAQLRGRVADGAGKAVPQARVRILAQPDPILVALESRGLDAPFMIEVRTGKRGTFRADVPQGSLYRLETRFGDRVSRVRHAVRPGSLTHLSLMSGCRIILREAKRHDWDGGAQWHVLGFDRERHEEFFLAAGRASSDATELPRLAPGRYRLRFVTDEGRSWEHRLHLAPGAAIDLVPALVPPKVLVLSQRAVVRMPFPFHQTPPADRSQPALRAIKEVRLPAFDLWLPLGIQVAKTPMRVYRIQPTKLNPGSRLEIASVGRSIEVGNTTPLQVVFTWAEAGVRSSHSLRLLAGTSMLENIPQVDALALCHDASGRWQAIRVAADAESTTLAPDAVGVAKVTVRGADGQPLRQAKLIAFPVDLPQARGLEHLFPTLVRYPNRGGRVVIDALPPGDWQLRVEAAWHVPFQERVTLKAGENIERDVQLERGFRVHGRVVGTDGEPAAGVLVTIPHPLVGDRTAPLDAITHSDGTFIFGGLPEGVWLVEARRRRGTGSELARAQATAGPAPVILKLVDEDPRKPHKF